MAEKQWTDEDMQKMLEEVQKKLYHCKVREVEEIANAMNRIMCDALSDCDKKDFVGAQLLLPYLHANVDAMGVVVGELKRLQEKEKK